MAVDAAELFGGFAQAVLARNLLPRCPAADLFGHKGRRWLADQDLPIDEQRAVAARCCANWTSTGRSLVCWTASWPAWRSSGTTCAG